MLHVHFLELLFGGVVVLTIGFILGALDGVSEEKEVVYTPEMDAEWAELVRVIHSRQGGK